MFGSLFSPSHLHSHSLSEGSLWPKHRWMNDITWGPWLIRNLSTQIIKNAHISVCFLVIYYDFTMSHTVETMGLISKGIAIYEELYFPFMMPGSYHCNYSLSFNSVDLTFALLERFKYIRFLIKKKKATVHLRSKSTLCHFKHGDGYFLRYVLLLMDKGNQHCPIQF